MCDCLIVADNTISNLKNLSLYFALNYYKFKKNRTWVRKSYNELLYDALEDRS